MTYVNEWSLGMSDRTEDPICPSPDCDCPSCRYEFNNEDEEIKS